MGISACAVMPDNISPPAAPAAPENTSAPQETFFGYKMKEVSAFAPDSESGEHIATLWRQNRRATQDADQRLEECSRNRDASDWCRQLAPLIDWLQKTKEKSLNDRIAEVQDMVNRLVQYQEDKYVGDMDWNRQYIENHRERFDQYERDGKSDFFLTYEEAFHFGAGDCDDYAIMKYDLLRHLGVPENKMMLVLLGLNRSSRPIVYSSGTPVNREEQIGSTIDGHYYSPHALLVVKNERGQKIVMNNEERLFLDEHWNFIPVYGVSGQSQWQAFSPDKDSPLNKIIKSRLLHPGASDSKSFLSQTTAPRPQ
jgi:predicted transglutaminase-like cysteine proteinase